MAVSVSWKCRLAGRQACDLMYICLLICVSFFTSSVTSSSLSWDFQLHKHARPVGDILLTSPQTGPSLSERTRRDVDPPLSHFPTTLTFSFMVEEDDVRLVLHKNKFINVSPPLFVLRQGKIVEEKGQDDMHDYAYYQDRETGAAVMVTRSEDGQSYHVTGSYFHDGEEYAIQPIRDTHSDDVDHRIFKLFQEANLQHDVIDFGSDLLYAASMEESVSVERHLLQNTNATTVTITTSNDNNKNYSSNSVDLDDISINNNSSIISSGEVDVSEENSATNKTSHESEMVGEKDGTLNKTQGGSKAGPDELMTHISGENRQSEDISGRVKISQLGQIDKAVEDNSDSAKDDMGEARKKRQAGSYVLELLMVIDYGVYEIWYDGVTGLQGEARRAEALRRIKQFYSFVLNGIDLRYSSVQRVADLQMDVTWAGIIVFDAPVADYWKEAETPPQSSRDFVEASAALEAFRAWAEGQGEELPPSDHVMLFTGHNLTYGGSVSNAGLAYLGSACNPEYFFSIVEEYFEFRDVAIAAHELGHSLGARHDMDGNTCLSFDRYIMTSRFKFPSQRKAQNPWLFSKCSVDYFKDFIDGLDKNDTNCLVTRDARLDNKEIQPFLVALPGEVYMGDDFCRLGDGAESYICRDQHIKDYSNVCYGGIYCYRPQEKLCAPKLPPDGFSCGNRKWCVNGTCQASQLAPATVADDCPFGDDPGLIGGKTCAERMLTSRYDCYRDAFRAKCCASCRRYRRNLPGCEYGDLFELCKKEQCVNYEEEYARENCCDTCAELLFTIPSTIATTTTPFLPTTPKVGGTTTRTGDATSQKGKTTGGKNGRRNQISSPDGSRDGEEAGRGEGGGKGKTGPNNRQRYARKGDDSDSSESDDSDEVSLRAGNNLRKTRYNIRGDNQPYIRDERMNLIRDLLDGMRNSRDSHRSQRMRLLVTILDRLREEDSEDFISNWQERRRGEGQGVGDLGVGEMGGGYEDKDRLIDTMEDMMDDESESDSSSDESK